MKPKKEKMDDWRRLRLALIVIVEGVLLCSSQPVRASLQVVEMVQHLESFEAFPWGRESFLLTMRMVKVSQKVNSLSALIAKFNQSHSSTHGFPLVFQLLMLKAIPVFERYLNQPDDTQTIIDGSITTLPPLKTFHNSNIMETELIPGLRIAPLLSTDDPPHPSINDWPDEVSDPAIDYMESLIGGGYKFCQADWIGGCRTWPKIVVDENPKEPNVRKTKKVPVRRPNINSDMPEFPQGGPSGSSKGKGKVDEDFCPPAGTEGKDVLHALIMEEVNSKFRDMKEELKVELMGEVCRMYGVEKSLLKDELLDEIISNLRHGGKFPTTPPPKAASPGKNKPSEGQTYGPPNNANVNKESGGHTDVPLTNAVTEGQTHGPPENININKVPSGQTSDSPHVQIDPPAPSSPQSPSKGKSNSQLLEEFQRQAWSEYGGVSDVLQNLNQSYASPSGPAKSGPFGPSPGLVASGPSTIHPSPSGPSSSKFSIDHNPKDFQTPLPTISEDNAEETEDEEVADEVLVGKSVKENFPEDHNPNDFQTPHQDVEEISSADESEDDQDTEQVAGGNSFGVSEDVGFVGEERREAIENKSVGVSEHVDVVECEDRREEVIEKSVDVSGDDVETEVLEDKSVSGDHEPKEGDESSGDSEGRSEDEDHQDEAMDEANKAWPPELFKSSRGADEQLVDDQEGNATGGVAISEKSPSGKKRKSSSLGGDSSKPILPPKRARNKPHRFRDPIPVQGQESTGTNSVSQSTDEVLHPFVLVNDDLRKHFLSTLKSYRQREFVLDAHVVPRSFFKDMLTPHHSVHQEVRCKPMIPIFGHQSLFISPH
ncbi:uncharacterized protein LOC110230862 [Arabidopsis lyrata subsp. lyrata]|uniref:uncharacterized protein LOC110230862 n=1 Tax=Arabidopsis lyrata subsp. lyrata TaxID=81972 RepID=UPI000A29BA88|nr:uncharacterized protein LOC110230862 [Arabidopsis lyrata subsp. lyrata]|eukprot:XP_020890719.1 uncharacterized protein LOC110230862 [Arabidopsis lyrata subsp. lyrata]